MGKTDRRSYIAQEIEINIIGKLVFINWGDIPMTLTDEEDNLSLTILADGWGIAFVFC